MVATVIPHGRNIKERFWYKRGSETERKKKKKKKRKKKEARWRGRGNFGDRVKIRVGGKKMWAIDWLRRLWWGRRRRIFGLPKQERGLPRIGRKRKKNCLAVAGARVSY